MPLERKNQAGRWHCTKGQPPTQLPCHGNKRKKQMDYNGRHLHLHENKVKEEHTAVSPVNYGSFLCNFRILLTPLFPKISTFSSSSLIYLWTTICILGLGFILYPQVTYKIVSHYLCSWKKQIWVKKDRCVFLSLEREFQAKAGVRWTLLDFLRLLTYIWLQQHPGTQWPCHCLRGYH